MTPAIRVGQGFDVHRFSDDPTRPLVLGGVTFAGHPGLAGHSDADAVAHAVAEALLGASGLGNIGEHFPDTDPRWAGVDSLQLLRAVAVLVRDAGWSVGNVDCSVVCEIPKLAPRRDEMQRRLSDAAGGPVTVKGRRAEGLGAIGRSEGIACWAVALVTADDRTADAAARGERQRDGGPSDGDQTSNHGGILAGGDAQRRESDPTGDDEMSSPANRSTTTNEER